MRAVVGVSALCVVLSGCLGAPSERTCADYPRDTPGCADYWGDAGGLDGGRVDGAAPDGMVDGMLDVAPDGMADGAPDDMGGVVPDGMSDGMPDGAPDLGGCAPGETVACGSDEGECAPGMRTCQGGVLGPCEGAVGPGVELCNGLDDDCDGMVDNAAQVGMACTAGVGACEAEGVVVCTAGGPPLPVCDAVEGEGSAERCNAVDDDCDGETDEGIGQRLRSLRLPSMDAGTVPTMAARGEFFGAVWIGPEGGLGYALFAGEAFEVEPYAYEEFAGGDRQPFSAALDAHPAGFSLALSFCDVGGCGTSVSLINERGEFVRSVSTGSDATDRITVATSGEGAGLAWGAPGVQGQLGVRFAHAADFMVGAVNSVLIEAAGELYTAPALAWGGARYGLVYVAGRSPDAGVVEFRALDVNGGTLEQVVLSGAPATSPSIEALRGHDGYAVSWIEVVDEVSVVRGGVIDRAGGWVAGPFDLGSGGDSPATVVYDDGLGERVERVGFAWLAVENNRRRLTMRWIAHVEGEWVARSTVRLGEARSAAGLSGAFSVDSGPGLLWRDFDGISHNPLAVSGDFGCPTGPGLP